MSMQRAKRREESTKGTSTPRRRTQDPPPRTSTRLHPLNTSPKPEHRPKHLTPRKHPHPKLLPSTQTPTQLPLPTKMSTLLYPPPLSNPGQSSSKPKIPTPNPYTPSTALPPQKKNKKKKKKTHIGVGASLSALAVATLVWEAGERKPTRLLVATLVWEPRAGGGREATPLFQMTTRNEQGTRQPDRHNSKCRIRPDGGHVSEYEVMERHLGDVKLRETTIYTSVPP